MKPLVLALLLALVASVECTLAQTSTAPPSATPSPSAQPDATSPPAVERPGAADDPAALPRGPVERTTIFGMSPTAAVIVAASLLVVVIVAIVAMTRNTNAYIDLDRRD